MFYTKKTVLLYINLKLNQKGQEIKISINITKIYKIFQKTNV